MIDTYEINVIGNRSTTYILPIINEQINLTRYQRACLIDTFLSFDDGDDVFCILIAWNSSPEFLKFEGELMKNHLFLGHKDYGDKTLYKFKLSINMLKSKREFIDGRLKDLSSEHKASILEFNKEALNIERIKLILDPKSQLVSTPPDMVDETFKKQLRKTNLIIEDFADESN